MKNKFPLFVKQLDCENKGECLQLKNFKSKKKRMRYLNVTIGEEKEMSVGRHFRWQTYLWFHQQLICESLFSVISSVMSLRPICSIIYRRIFQIPNFCFTTTYVRIFISLNSTRCWLKTGTDIKSHLLQQQQAHCC